MIFPQHAVVQRWIMTDLSGQASRQEQAAQLAEQELHASIIGALSNVFNALYCIDLEQNTFQEILSQGGMHHFMGEKGDARKTLRQLADTLAGDAHLRLMQSFMDYDTLGARLVGRSIISQEFATRSGGWTRCAFFPIGQSGSRTVLCTMRSITSEKEEMASQDNLIQALAIPYENIYAVNADTGEAICHRMGQTMHDRYGQRFAAGSYERNIRTYIDNDVLSEDRPLFSCVCSIDSVNRLLSDRKTYYFNYRISRGGRTQYFQCQLVKPNRDRNEFVIGFKNIDE